MEPPTLARFAASLRACGEPSRRQTNLCACCGRGRSAGTAVLVFPQPPCLGVPCSRFARRPLAATVPRGFICALPSHLALGRAFPPAPATRRPPLGAPAEKPGHAPPLRGPVGPLPHRLAASGVTPRLATLRATCHSPSHSLDPSTIVGVVRVAVCGRRACSLPSLRSLRCAAWDGGRERGRKPSPRAQRRARARGKPRASREFRRSSPLATLTRPPSYARRTSSKPQANPNDTSHQHRRASTRATP